MARKRSTADDIAARACATKELVSFALNDCSGVSNRAGLGVAELVRCRVPDDLSITGFDGRAIHLD